MKYLSYQDILLEARYSELLSRDLADTSVNFCGRKFVLPVTLANMEDVIDTQTAFFLSEHNYFYIMHRFNTDPYNFVSWTNNDDWRLISISCGVNETPEFESLKKIAVEDLRVDFITIDVAHGHHIKVKERLQWLRKNFPKTKLIAGNVMTPDAVKDLAFWGADAVKVGIGQGSICTTRFQTGFSKPMFSCVQDCCSGHKIPVIADGGIQHIGDIAKAIVAGAAMIMSGKLFASCINSPAQMIYGKKQYRGSTSFDVKKDNKHIEGKTLNLEPDITIQERLQEIKEALQSSISYSGGSDLSGFKGIEWVEGK